MYPYDFKPKLIGINHREVFALMPFAPKYDPIYNNLIVTATSEANNLLGINNRRTSLKPFRTKDDIRTTSGWINVLEHLNTAQIVIGVLTSSNPNVFYELGIAHATQPITRQILLASKGYKPKFDTKDLIFYRYNTNNLADDIKPLSIKIADAVNQYKIEKDKKILQGRMFVGPFDFEVIMMFGVRTHFAIHSKDLQWRDKYEQQYGQGSFDRHVNGITNLCLHGLLGLNTESISNQNGIRVAFSYWWTNFGNDILHTMGIIDDNELKKRRESLPDFFD